MNEKQEFIPKLVAVYGTLKEGHYNHGVMGDSTYLGTIKTEPIFTMHSLGYYPALNLNGNTSVTVEVYQVEDEYTLRRIYGLEGYNGIRGHIHNDFYDTTDIDTPWGKAEIFYMKDKLKSPVVEDGIWK